MARQVEVIGSYLSPYVRKVLAVLQRKSIGYGIDPIVPFFGGAAFEAVSPLRRVPVLQHTQANVRVVDSTIICEYLDEAFPNTPAVYPPTSAADRAAARWLEEYADSRVCDVLIWTVWQQKSIRPFVWGERGQEAVVERALSVDVPDVLGHLERMVAPLLSQSAGRFLFGGHPMVADFALAAPFRNMQLLGADLRQLPGAASAPLTVGLLERVLARPELAVLRPYEEHCLKVRPHLHRASLQENTDAPISTVFDVGTSQPRQGVPRL